MKDFAQKGQLTKRQEMTEPPLILSEYRAYLDELRSIPSMDERHSYLIRLVFQERYTNPDAVLQLEVALRKLQRYQILVSKEEKSVNLKYAGEMYFVRDTVVNAFDFFREYAGLYYESAVSASMIRNHYPNVSMYNDLDQDEQWLADVSWLIIEKLQEFVFS